MTSKIINSYTPQMQADEGAILMKLGIESGVAGAGGRSKAIAQAITNWTKQIDIVGDQADDLAKLTLYVEEYVRSTYLKIEGSVRTNLYLKATTIQEMDVIGDHLTKLQDRVPMLMPVLKANAPRKLSDYNHTLIVTLALAREARGAK